MIPNGRNTTKCKLPHLRCLPGSSWIEVTVPKLGSVMYDPKGKTWHRAGQGSLPPDVFIRRWGLGRVEGLIARLLRHDAKRRESYQQAQALSVKKVPRQRSE